MATTLTCGQCANFQTNRRTLMTPLGMHSCAKGHHCTYYDAPHVCHRLEAQPVPDRPAPTPPRGQIGLIGDRS